MSAENPRYYKYIPQETIDLGTMPFEGDWSFNDQIVTVDSEQYQHVYFYGKDSTNTYGFGRKVTKIVAGRPRTEFELGVTLSATTITATGEPAPVWFCYCGDGVCVVKLPNGEEVEPVET